jgi:hypothetical protein
MLPNTPSQAAEIVSALDQLIRDVEAWFGSTEKVPQPGSTALRELAAYPGLQCVQNAFCQSIVLIEVSAEHWCIIRQVAV